MVSLKVFSIFWKSLPYQLVGSLWLAVKTSLAEWWTKSRKTNENQSTLCIFEHRWGGTAGAVLCRDPPSRKKQTPELADWLSRFSAGRFTCWRALIDSGRLKRVSGGRHRSYSRSGLAQSGLWLCPRSLPSSSRQHRWTAASLSSIHSFALRIQLF